MVAVNNGVVIFGLLCSGISFVIWWYSPSSTSECITRTWFLGIGYTNVVAAIYIFVFSMNQVYIKTKNNIPSQKIIGWRDIVVAYVLLEGIEIGILLLWTFVENPESKEILVSQIQWTTKYECNLEYRVIDTIQYIYFCIISAFGCVVIYR